MFTQTQTAKYKKFNSGIQNPLSVISNDTMYPTSSHIFSLVFWGPDEMLSIAITRDLKENMKSLLVICTEHETWSNSKQNSNQVTFW